MKLASSLVTPCALALLLCAAAAPSAGAQTEGTASGWSGHLGISSNSAPRGISETADRPAVNAGLEWNHGSGAYLALDAASVSSAQYGNGDGMKLSPALGWRVEPVPSWRLGTALKAQLFPGAKSARQARLSAVSAAQTSAEQSDFATAELSASVGVAGWTLSYARSLTDYLGARQRESNPSLPQAMSERTRNSTGSTYIDLGLRHAVNESVTLTAGVGRLRVRNFDVLNYTDWRFGAQWTASGLVWSVQASGSDARAEFYRFRTGEGERDASGSRVSAAASWLF